MTRLYDDEPADVTMARIDTRAQLANAMDDAATALLLAAERLTEHATAASAREQLLPLVRAWRDAVRAYRNAGGGRTDQGGLVDA
jgi:type VI protein secretion system component VasF